MVEELEKEIKELEEIYKEYFKDYTIQTYFNMYKVEIRKTKTKEDKCSLLVCLKNAILNEIRQISIEEIQKKYPESELFEFEKPQDIIIDDDLPFN